MSRSLSVTTPTELEIEMSREFDAPRGLVFAALTTPELLRRWHYGPDGWSLVTCEIDLRAGGAYRYVWRGPDRTEMVAPERIVNTESFDEAWYTGQALVTAVLAEREGGTTLTTVLRYESREARDMALRSGMEDGVATGYDRLAGALPGMADDHSGTA
jgi:uncharacterized protein YndB with AHSA1/START domain